MKIVTISRAEFDDRYARVHTHNALVRFTPPADTNVLLTLVNHYQPKTLLEIGTSYGDMTANLARWAVHADAAVYTMGLTLEMGVPAETQARQSNETPTRADFGRYADHFGFGHKVMFIHADSTRYNFARLPDMDFVYVDGAHDVAAVLGDTRNTYAILKPGGVLAWHDFDSPRGWVGVRRGIEHADLRETVYHVAGTMVAFLVKDRH